MNKFISFSGGVESSTMCVLFGNTADAIFADTGFEHQLIYDRIDLIETFCKNFHRPDFKIHRIKSKHGTLPEQILKYKLYPSFTSRFCTREFKIDPIDNFLKQYENEGCELMIGLNYDEQDRIDKQHGNKPHINYSYPLAENKLNRGACIEILKKVKLYPNFPPYMKRGGCIGCFYKSKKEYEAMALLNPLEFKIVEDLENKLQLSFTVRDKFYTIKENITMKQIREYALQSLFNPDEVYATINDATPCGVFCNR
jgi:3'-phosphoadenosine 5'-phosphosulfate sulfotransferase (PAPS reductase)/FAD synthetase